MGLVELLVQIAHMRRGWIIRRKFSGVCLRQGQGEESALLINADRQRFDPASLLILDRLNQVLSCLHDEVLPRINGGGTRYVQPPTEIQHDADGNLLQNLEAGKADHDAALLLSINQVHQALSEDRTQMVYLPPEANDVTPEESPADYLRIPSCRTTADTVLQWPIFQSEYPPDYLIRNLYLTVTGTGPQDGDWAQDGSSKSMATFGVQEDQIEELVDNFLAFVHTKNPILDADALRMDARRIAEDGPRWDANCCLVVSKFLPRRFCYLAGYSC